MSQSSSDLLTVLGAIPQQPQRQDSLADQMNDLYLVAIRLGCHDAADWIAGLSLSRDSDSDSDSDAR